MGLPTAQNPKKPKQKNSRFFLVVQILYFPRPEEKLLKSLNATVIVYVASPDASENFPGMFPVNNVNALPNFPLRQSPYASSPSQKLIVFYYNYTTCIIII